MPRTGPSVVDTDVLARACRFARVTAAINGLRDVLAAGLTGHDALGRAGTHQDLQALPGTRPVVAVGVRGRRGLDPGAVDPRPVHLVNTRRWGRVVDASTALAGLVGACDGQLTVGQVVGALADLLEEPEPDLRARLLPAVRDLVAEGLLVLPWPSPGQERRPRSGFR